MSGKWIWYYGDFEIRHGILQNCSREERGFSWPAYWNLDDCRKNIRFYRSYTSDWETVFTVYSHQLGYVELDGVKYPFRTQIRVRPGNHEIRIFCGSVSGLPAVFVEGETIFSDESWLADDFVSEAIPVGVNEFFTRKEQNPEVWEYQERIYKPMHIVETEKGVLMDFEEELTAVVRIQAEKESYPLHMCYGESEAEATDVQWCYYSQILKNEKEDIPRRAFRYLFFPGKTAKELHVEAVHQYVDLPIVGRFYSSDNIMNQIWKTAETTFRLCSGIFFLDGVKRDKWIWSGDAYQSYFINQYLMFDEDINRRTILALRGNDPVCQHINTIVDYSMYWIISVYNHYMAFGDLEFVRRIYPKMQSMMQFLEQQTDEHGFMIGRPGDWIFIDWADMDKDGPVCAEQMLLIKCWNAMVLCAELLEEDSAHYRNAEKKLLENTQKFYWREEKGAYIDSFVSGKDHVTRHGNIFALLFGIAEEKQKEQIFRNVIHNPEIPEITTPYFKFYELEAICQDGRLEDVKQRIKDYWGGMLNQGAASFWEEYDPKQFGTEQYGMYGDPYGKSLCHAWAGSPIYLIGRYFMGVKPLEAGYERFQVAPNPYIFQKAECIVPVKDGIVEVKWEKGALTIYTDCSGGEVVWKGQRLALKAGKYITIQYEQEEL